MVSNPLWIPVQGTWRVPPCRRTVATQPVSPLRVLSANFPPCFPSSHLLLDSYNPIDVALHERDASTRISPLPDCHCVYLLACVVGGTNVTTRYDRIILRTFVCPPPSRLILHPVFPSPSPFFFFFLGDFYRSILLEVKGGLGFFFFITQRALIHFYSLYSFRLHLTSSLNYIYIYSLVNFMLDF